MEHHSDSCFDYVTMGLRIKQRRQELNITQASFAETLMISNNHLSAIENGHEKPSFDLFIRMCNALNVTPDFLILGLMNTNDAPKQILDNLKLCTRDEIELIKHITEYYISKR